MHRTYEIRTQTQTHKTVNECDDGVRLGDQMQLKVVTEYTIDTAHSKGQCLHRFKRDLIH